MKALPTVNAVKYFSILLRNVVSAYTKTERDVEDDIDFLL
jgi:hypothetical protein